MTLTDLHTALRQRAGQPGAPAGLADVAASISPVDAIAGAFRVLAPGADAAAPQVPAGLAAADLGLLREVCAVLAAYHFHGLGAVAAAIGAALPPPALPALPPLLPVGLPQPPDQEST